MHSPEAQPRSARCAGGPEGIQPARNISPGLFYRQAHQPSPVLDGSEERTDTDDTHRAPKTPHLVGDGESE